MTAPIGSNSASASTAGAASAAGQTSGVPIPSNNSMGQDDFLKLLVAQMKNQDPTNPMQAQDLAAQLAQFSSLNQLVAINSALGTQNTSSQGIEQAVTMNTAASTLGRTVTALGNQVAITTGQPSSVTINVGGTGGDATLHVFDASGSEVGTEKLGTLNAGRQTVSLGTMGSSLATGAYTYSVDGTDGSGNPMTVTTYTVGKIDSLQATANGPMLGAGSLTIPFSSVIAISAGG